MPMRGSLEAWLCGVFGVYWLGIGFGFDRRALPAPGTKHGPGHAARVDMLRL